MCDLEYCDFLECEIREYNSKEEFFADKNDSNYMLRENGNEKGIVLEYYNLSTKKNDYIYNYDNFKTLEEFEKWEETEIDKILEDDNLDYNGTTFWRLNKYNVVLVKRNREWFSNNYSKIAQFWNNVEEARKNNTYAEFINNKNKQKFEKAKYLENMPKINFID